MSNWVEFQDPTLVDGGRWKRPQRRSRFLFACTFAGLFMLLSRESQARWDLLCGYGRITYLAMSNVHLGVKMEHMPLSSDSYVRYRADTRLIGMFTRSTDIDTENLYAMQYAALSRAHFAGTPIAIWGTSSPVTFAENGCNSTAVEFLIKTCETTESCIR